MHFLPFRVMYGTAREGKTKTRKGLYSMKIRFNATGAQRKALVKAIADITGADSRYLGVPSLCYEVDYLTIDREGTLIFDDSADTEEIENLLEGLAQRGFVAEKPDKPGENREQAPEAAAPAQKANEAKMEDDDCFGLTIAMNAAGFDDAAWQNLKNLVNSKEGLIKKALGIDALPMMFTKEKISFPWFETQPDEDVAKAAMELAAALCRTAKTLTRVTAKERMVPNEKYAFRCFLLRLGFIGAEHKETRKVLLRNLSGNGAFRDGKRKEAAGHEIPQQGEN